MYTPWHHHNQMMNVFITPWSFLHSHLPSAGTLEWFALSRLYCGWNHTVWTLLPLSSMLSENQSWAPISTVLILHTPMSMDTLSMCSSSRLLGRCLGCHVLVIQWVCAMVWRQFNCTMACEGQCAVFRGTGGGVGPWNQWVLPFCRLLLWLLAVWGSGWFHGNESRS